MKTVKTGSTFQPKGGRRIDGGPCVAEIVSHSDGLIVYDVVPTSARRTMPADVFAQIWEPAARLAAAEAELRMRHVDRAKVLTPEQWRAILDGDNAEEVD